jgi:hypothetical protein
MDAAEFDGPPADGAPFDGPTANASHLWLASIGGSEVNLYLSEAGPPSPF